MRHREGPCGTTVLTNGCRALSTRARSLARRAAVMRCREEVAKCHQPMELIIMEHTKELLSVPLASLVPSRFNVRRHSVGQVEELAALIASQGLLHNLVVTEQAVGRGKSRKLKFAVAAGERRRRAMLLLQQRGRLPKEYEVLCELVPPERALEVSLAENSGREAMHPADEFEAFKALIDEGKGVEDVAARFGVSVLTVQRRLKLSALSPKLLALYREDGINLDQLMALTLSDDHAVQERTWFDAQPWDKTPAALRRRMTVGEVEAAGSALVRFVGIEAYEAAGGVVRRDLFDDEQSRFLSDSMLLERLAKEKLEVLAATVREEGWKWVEARLSVDSQALRQLVPCAHVSRKPTTTEQEELDALASRAAELEQQAQALDDAPEWSADEAEMIDLEEQDIAARRKAISEALKTWTPEHKTHAGVIVTIGRDGDVEVMRGLVRDEDRRAMAAAERTTSAMGFRGPNDTGDDDQCSPPPLTAPERRAPGCSEALTKRLAAHRTMALQAMLTQNAAVALASLAHVFVLRTFGADYPREASALQVSPQLSAHVLEAAADDLKASRAWQEVEKVKEAWRARLPEDQGAWLAWLIALPQDELIDLLALCSALTVNALPGASASASADAIAAALGLDMAEWWEPTAEAYLHHVPKAQIIAALKEAGPELAGGGVEAMKKDALVSTAASRLAGTRWLPEPLRLSPG
ncbi:MAG: chromosome partitioning protein ParB [Betaproteobacteria bacterium]|nr:chromosome partitioning protein ParB [Betaproteobacteria bacterium]